MIIINVLYVLLLFLACYKHTQDILEEKYKRLHESATGMIKHIKTSSKDASSKVCHRCQGLLCDAV